MPEVLTERSVDYKTAHLLPRLRVSTEDAGGYIAANLADNADVPEVIALAFQDVIEAYDLPINVTTDERSRLESAVVEAAKKWNSTNHRDTLKCEQRLSALGDAVDALEQFESSLNIKK